MSTNALTGHQVTNEDLLLIIGDQTVTIAVLRQQVADARTTLESSQKQYQSVLAILARERDQAAGANVPPSERYAGQLGQFNPSARVTR